MANEIQVAYNTTNAGLYALVRNTAGQVWQTTSSTFVSYVTANLANYKIGLNEQGTASRYYAGNFPAAALGVYNVSVYAQAGGSPAETDLLVAEGSIDWDGAAIAPVANVPNALLDLTNGIETNLTFRQGLRLIVAALAGKVSGAGTTTITFRNTPDTKNRIVAIVDTNGNRSTVTFDLT